MRYIVQVTVNRFNVWKFWFNAILAIIAGGILAGCVVDEIEIRMVSSGIHPQFDLSYVRKPSADVKAFSIIVTEVKTGRKVWEVRTYDPDLLFDKRDGHVRVKSPDEIEQEKIKLTTVKHFYFGEVPNGFSQIFPIENKTPDLKEDRKYLLQIAGGRGPGRLEFTTQQECRRISITSYSNDLPSFNPTDLCTNVGK